MGFFGATGNKETENFIERQRRLKAATLLIFDEYSMVGRQMLGKIHFRLHEYLGDLRALDIALAGDSRQASPIGDEPLHRVGPYTGKGLNKPRSGNAPAGTPTMAALTQRGCLFRDEFEDVVILREVHRIDKAVHGLSPEAGERYIQDAERFLQVTGGMAECTWTLEDHAWLSKRNKSRLVLSESGRREVASFQDAPLLMDGRRRRADGTDGAEQVNEQELCRLAQKTGHPILECRSYHDRPEKEKGLRPELMDAEDFRGLAASLRVSEDARVLLTKNEWPEAGLMNGALGCVRGYVWPQGGDPGSSDTDKQAPVCIIVEFDDVDLGEEEVLGPDGKVQFASPGVPLMKPRCFFPDLDLGVDGKGRARNLKCVPVFRDRAVSVSDDKVARHQFPLVLAWALTHWKAQGMTLPRARVRLGPRAAAMPGIGFVAVTRVKHPSHLMFEEDFPSWEDFQSVQWKAAFRSRQRYDLRNSAKASRTLRKYGTCAADLWTEEEQYVAGRLIRCLRAEGRRRSVAFGLSHDPDAWLWPEEEPDLPLWLQTGVGEVVGEGRINENAAQSVAERLLGPWHVAAVREALGCLIPRELSARFDGRKPPNARGSQDMGPTLHVTAGGWKVNGFQEEQRLAQGQLSKGLCEFFVIVFRRLCQKLSISVGLGSHKLGLHLHAAPDAAQLRLGVRCWHTWEELQQEMLSAQQVFVPVCVTDSKVLRDCVLLRLNMESLTDSSDGQEKTHVTVWDPVQRTGLAEHWIRNLHGLL